MAAPILDHVIETPLRLAALTASLLVLAGFLLQAHEEIDRASTAQAARVHGEHAAATTAPQAERARERLHGGAREALADANDVLLAPFALVTDDLRDPHLRRGLTTLLALLAYGLGLGTLARYARAR
jgi:hypothetical protein